MTTPRLIRIVSLAAVFYLVGFIGNISAVEEKILSEAKQSVKVVDSIEITPGEKIIKTKDKQIKVMAACGYEPYFEINPIKQEGDPGSMLSYKINIKNLDYHFCEKRTFTISGQSPLVSGEQWHMGFFTKSFSNDPTIARPEVSRFTLFGDEDIEIEMEITSRTNWPFGEYAHLVRLDYGLPGEEFLLGSNLTRKIVYSISSSETKQCPSGCICSGKSIVCPAYPTCGSPCFNDGNNCVCPAEWPKTCKVGCSCVNDTIICPLKPVLGCELPCFSNGETCACPSDSETETCPFDCVCDRDLVVCPSNKKSVCEAENDCQLKGDSCICPTDREKVCPLNCVCQEDITVCPTTNTERIEAAISNQSILIEKSGDQLMVVDDDVSVGTTEKLISKAGKLYMETGRQEKEIKFTPKEATINGLKTMTKIESIKLEEINNRPVYILKGVKEKKFLGLLPINLSVAVKVDAETNSIFQTEYPWWNFLTR
jgi:hypothetical protein